MIEDITRQVYDIGMRHRGLRRFAALRIAVLMVYSGKGSLPESFQHSLWTYHANRALLDLFIVVEHSGDALRRKLEAKGFSNARFAALAS